MPRFRDYDEIKAINNSKLAHFKRSPEQYIHALHNKQPSTPGQIFGIAAHSWILEEEHFPKDILVMDESQRPVPDKDYKTHVNADWKREQFALAAEARKEIITVESHDIIKRMKDKVLKHELASELLQCNGNKFEEPIKWNWKKTRCKGLIDIWNPDFIADYKTAADADPDEFLRKFFYWEYHRQAGMYLDGDMRGKYSYESKIKEFYFIVQESVAPYAVAVYKVRREVINKGVEEYRNLCEQFQGCIDNKIWPGYEYKSIGGQMFEIELPAYMRD